MSAGGEVPVDPRDQLRASDLDRERVIEILKEAFTEGRLDDDEISERIMHARAARTYGQLGALTADIPLASSSVAPSQASSERPPKARARWTEALAVTSLGLGIASFALPSVVLIAFPGVLLGAIALVRSGSAQPGAGWIATAGMILAALGMANVVGLI